MNKSEPEIWKALPDAHGVEVSTLGNVRTQDRILSSVRRTYLKKGRILKQHDDGNGYLQVNIPIDGKQVTKKVHRLVAQTFIPNHDGSPQVNHKDCNRENNDVSNLEWCTHEENIAYREKYGTSAKDFVKKLPVFAVNLTTLEVSRFRSQHEAGRVLGVSNGSINDVLKGKRKQAGGYFFVNDDNNAANAVRQKLHSIGKTGLKLNA